MKTAPILAGIMLALLPNMLFAESDTIVLDSDPRGASVYWQGIKMGVTPLTITSRTADAPDFFRPDHPSFTLYVHKEFHQTAIPRLTYQPGSDNRHLIRLKLLPRLPLYNGVFARRSRLRIATLINADLDELARMREEVYARYGRPVMDKRFSSYFSHTRWYKENPYYSDAMLSYSDKHNIKLINDFLEVNDTDVALFRRITKQYEYRSADGKDFIRFINARTCVVGSAESDDANKSIIPYYLQRDQEFGFVVAGGVVYLRGYGHAVINLDLNKNRFLGISITEEY